LKIAQKSLFLAAPYFGLLRDFGRIVGGQEATQAISYQMTVYPGMKSLCGGTMLDEWTVLTAAHCFPLGEGIYASNTRVQAGALEQNNDPDAQVLYQTCLSRQNPTMHHSGKTPGNKFFLKFFFLS
jgi:hypothetical protein